MKKVLLFEEFLDEAKKKMDNPCWKGYTMYGTKTDEDGNEVPNCIPVEESNNIEDSYNDYPEAAKKNAQLAIDWKEKYGRDEVEAGTAVGWARAHQLAKGENISGDTVKRMASFNRHRKNSTIAPEFKETPWLDKGYVSWLIWGGDEGVDWALEKSKTITERKSLFEEFLLEKGKKSKPKTDKQKINDLSKKQKGLAKKVKDIKGDMLDLSKDKEKEPTDKLQGLLLKTQMTQSAVDAKKAEVQIQQIGLKAKLKTAKKKEKALKDAEKDNPKPEVKPKEKSNKDNPKIK
jgi:hypothetical protein